MQDTRNFMQRRRRELIKIMDEHNLTCEAAGKLVGRTTLTVRGWRCKHSIPAIVIPALRYALSERKSAPMTPRR